MVEELNDMNDQQMDFGQEPAQGRPTAKAAMTSNYRSTSERDARVI
jgi:hypothetical protein